MKIIDKTGNRYGKLVVIRLSHREFRSSRLGSYNFWLCLCDCGRETIVLGNNLAKGNTKSCGCMSSRHTSKMRMTTHGEGKIGKRTRTYNSWRAMKDRCYSKNHKEYKRYGALGIEVCDRWKNNYDVFLSDMGERPENKTLDRINPFGNYEPSNCRWADSATQQNNRRIHFLRKNNE